jgi:hypothetical protein
MSDHKTLGESLSQRIEQADTIVKGVLAELREKGKRYVPELWQKDEIRERTRHTRQLEEAEELWLRASVRLRAVARKNP